MNTKFFFSAIAMFAITSAANALPFGVIFPRVNEEVATSAVIKSAAVSGVNEEVATSAVIKGAQVSGVNEEVATSAVIKGVEFKSGMELAAKRGPHFPPFIVDTEKPMEVAIYHPLRH